MLIFEQQVHYASTGQRVYWIANGHGPWYDPPTIVATKEGVRFTGAWPFLTSEQLVLVREVLTQAENTARVIAERETEEG